jgi:undecaprenyl-diphosphatase
MEPTHLSLNQKLFLHINNYIGKNKWFDNVMIFFAKYMIFIMFFCVLLYALTLPKSYILFFLFYLAIMVVFGMFVSLVIAFLWRHPRPIVEMPYIRRLVKTLGTWKSFPSDHTFASILMPLFVWGFGATWWFVIILSIVGIGIAISRVYVAAHYPRDILGGMLLAVIIFFTLINIDFLI